MNRFSSILLKVKTLNPNTYYLTDIAVRINGQDVNFTLTDNRMFELRNLIALRQIDIKIIFAIKARKEIDLSV